MQSNNNHNREAIRAVENKYGVLAFNMAFSNLMEHGWKHFTEESVQAANEQIREEEAEIKRQGKTHFMTANFQIGIMECCLALSKFSIMDLFAYIKTDMAISVE